MKTSVRGVWPALVVCVCVPALAEDNDTAAGGHTSARVSAAIRSGLPTFNSVPADKKPADEAKPEGPNELVAMPKYIVRERSPLDDDTVMTKERLKDRMKKMYPGATLPGLADPTTQIVPNYADLMYRDDRRLKAKAEMESLSSAVHATGNKEEAKALDKEIQKTFMRSHNWRDEGLDRSINGYRR